MVDAYPSDILRLCVLVFRDIRDFHACARRNLARLWQFCEPAISAAWRARRVCMALWLAVPALSGAGINPVARLSLWRSWIFGGLHDGRLLWRLLRCVQLLGLRAVRHGPAAA